MIWRKNYSPKSSARHFSVDHDYVLVYAKSAAKWIPNLVPRTEAQDRAYSNRDNDPQGPWKASDLSARNYYSLGTYPVDTPSGRTIDGPPAGRYWSVSHERLRELDRDGRIWWGRNRDSAPSLKRFLSDVKNGRVPQTYWHYDEVGHTQDAKQEIVSLFGDDVFGTPKPERLMKRIVEIATRPSDIVLDSFLGSGTTAAVAHKMGRRWIGVEIGEHATSHCVPRMQRVVGGEQGGVSRLVLWTGGGGFRFARLGDRVFDESGSINPRVRFVSLAAYLWFAQTREPSTSASLNSPLLGIHGGTAIVLLYNGVLGDRDPAGGNVLTHALWQRLRALSPDHAGRWLVFGEACRLGAATLKRFGIEFRQIPYELGMR